jgi:DNA-binding MarR family transcriptional regulator
MTDLARLLLEARRELAHDLDADMAERGYPELRPAHTSLFLSIDRRSGSRLVELAEEARVSKQAMMAIVDDLESRGYVRRIADPTDTRAKLVRLTTRGRSAAAECRRAVLSVDQRTKRRLGDRAYDALVDALVELAEPDGMGA